MKSYTDIEQSKVLAEILPLESADMSYSFDFDSEIYEISTTSYKSWVVPKYAQPDDGFGQVIPCWSLTALLYVSPNGIVMNKDSQNGRYHFSSTHAGTYVTTDNPVDACVAMIEKLHELNLL